jgi:hypothetical protein
MNDYMTAAELADLFRTTEKKVMEWQRQYDWPRTVIGRQFLWSPEQVEQIKALHAQDGGEVKPSAGRIEKDGRTQRSASRRKAS